VNYFLSNVRPEITAHLALDNNQSINQFKIKNKIFLKDIRKRLK
jgi:hypothetical protein